MGYSIAAVAKNKKQRHVMITFLNKNFKKFSEIFDLKADYSSVPLKGEDLSYMYDPELANIEKYFDKEGDYVEEFEDEYKEFTTEYKSRCIGFDYGAVAGLERGFVYLMCKWIAIQLGNKNKDGNYFYNYDGSELSTIEEKNTKELIDNILTDGMVTMEIEEWKSFGDDMDMKKIGDILTHHMDLLDTAWKKFEKENIK